MATITKTSMQGFGQKTMVETTLTASNTFVYDESKAPVMILRNATAGALSPIIDGAGGTTVDVAGVGPVSVAAGYAVGSIAAGSVRVIPLNTISAYLKGVIDITGATGIVASILEY